MDLVYACDSAIHKVEKFRLKFNVRASYHLLAISFRKVGASLWCTAKQHRESNRAQGIALCCN